VLGLASEPEGAVRLGQQGAAGVRLHFSSARMADRTLEVYAGVLRGEPKSAAALVGA
jgi:hypothetical protein